MHSIVALVQKYSGLGTPIKMPLEILNIFNLTCQQKFTKLGLLPFYVKGLKDYHHIKVHKGSITNYIYKILRFCPCIYVCWHILYSKCWPFSNHVCMSFCKRRLRPRVARSTLTWISKRDFFQMPCLSQGPGCIFSKKSKTVP